MLGAIVKSDSVAVGGSAAINEVSRQTDAIVGEATDDGATDTGKIKSDGNLTVSATNAGTTIAAGASGSVSSGKRTVDVPSQSATYGVGVSGSVAINTVDNEANAKIKNGLTAGVDAKDISVMADEATAFIAASGGFTLSTGQSSSVGVLGAYSHNNLTLTQSALVEDTKIDSSSLSLDSQVNSFVLSGAVGLQGSSDSSRKSGKHGNIAGSVALNSIDLSTQTIIDGSNITNSNAITLSASDNIEGYGVAGTLGIAKSQALGGTGVNATVGVSVAVNDLSGSSTEGEPCNNEGSNHQFYD